MVKPYFAMTGLSEDIQGRLWVVTARSDGRSTEVDVFAPSGRFLGTVSLRGQVRSLAWRGTRVAAVVERAEGEEALGAVDFYRVR
jgi:sugar lactone lactonase YvrE